jgi:GMP reductase
MTGVGYGTFSCVQECSHAAHGLKSDKSRLGLVMSDGGCRSPGDVCKALCGGADWVMLGGMFAGTDECEGEWQLEGGRKTSLTFYGMSSHYAQEKHGSGRKEYRASEGKVSNVPHKGPVSEVVQELLGGIRSCGAYIGAKNLKDYSKCAKFVRVSR